MLPPRLQERVRQALAASGSLAVRTTEDGFVESVARGWPDIAVVDPTLTACRARVPISLREARVATLLYVQLTPAYATSLVEFVRQLAAPVVTFGYDDDPRTLASMLQRSTTATHGHVLLDRLAPQLRTLPPAVCAGIYRLNERSNHVDSVAQLASYCGVGRSTLSQRLREAGIGSAQRLVAGLALVRGYDVVVDSTLPAARAARLLGLASARSLDRRCRSLAGFPLAVMRDPARAPTLSVVADRVAAALATGDGRRRHRR
jgi:hypothetical protein